MDKSESMIKEEDFVRVDISKMNTDEIVRPAVSYWKGVWYRLRKDKVAVISMLTIVIIVILAIIGPKLVPFDYITNDLSNINAKPNSVHWFGTDSLGRDLWARVWVGARVSLLVGLFGSLLPELIGIIVGSISGYFGGWVDIIIMRFVDVMVCIPSIIFITLIMLWLGSGVVPLIIAIMLTSWMGLARSVRGRILQFKNREFVLASNTLGANAFHIMFKGILPNILGQIIVNITASMAAAIFLEASLSFIGLGIASPNTSWGQLANSGAANFLIFPYQLLFPSVFIGITVLAIYLLGNSLRDALDPHTEM